MPLAEEITKIQQLKDNGALTEEEFQRAKEALLAGEQASRAWGAEVSPPRSIEADTRTWAIFLHLSQFLWIVPLGGILAPILIWQLKKGDLPGLDEHGRIVVNWLLSALIYAAICVPLIIVLVGIPLLIALGILGLIFPIVGAVQAGKGAAWTYPMSIAFFK